MRRDRHPAGTTTKAGNPWSPSTVKLALKRLGLR